MKINYGRQELTDLQEIALVGWYRKKTDVRDAIKNNLTKLPQELQDFWNEPRNQITKSMFLEKASEYIEVPHSDIWHDDRSDVKFISDFDSPMLAQLV